MNTLRVTTIPNSAVVREPSYFAPYRLLVNGNPIAQAVVDSSRDSCTPVSHRDFGRCGHCGVRHISGLFLKDDTGTIIQAHELTRTNKRLPSLNRSFSSDAQSDAVRR
jgi:hypothetical protein